MQVRIHVSGRNYHRAAALPQRLTLPDGCPLDAALEALAAALPEGEHWQETCLLAVAGVHVGTWRDHRPAVLREGDEILLLMPVAGG
jgi:hypothetical protein